MARSEEQNAQRESYELDMIILARRGLTQIEIARELNISPRRVNRYAVKLKAERRWPLKVREFKPNITHTNPELFRDAEGRYLAK